jgi:hypothetical protein
MSPESCIRIFALALVLAGGVASSAQAQDSTVSGSSPSFSHIVGPPTLQINPRPLYRRCSSWYVVQYRPSGQVLFPEKHCWWVRG